MTDGMRTGAVEGYADGNCMFDGAAVPRASIYFIGLDAELPVPTPQDYMRDEVHLHDGSVHPGRLVSIDADNVVTDSASYSRTEVAWIWLTPMPPGEGQAAPSTPPGEDAAEEQDRPTYLWAGTIEVENRYAGRVGRHRWQAEYRIKLLEVPTNSTTPGRQLNVSFASDNLEPLELAYEIAADQNWDGEGHKVQYNNGTVVNGDVTMRGRADGLISGQTLVDAGVLHGSILRLDAATASAQPPTADIATEAAYVEYMQNYSSPIEAGWYVIYVGFVGHDMDYRGETGSPGKLLSIYDGIVRGGLQPPFFPDPYQDLVHWIPAYGSDVAVVGRLDDPDQAEVSGALSFSRDGNVGPGEQISIEWAFTRTRQ